MLLQLTEHTASALSRRYRQQRKLYGMLPGMSARPASAWTDELHRVLNSLDLCQVQNSIHSRQDGGCPPERLAGPAAALERSHEHTAEFDKRESFFIARP